MKKLQEHIGSNIVISLMSNLRVEKETIGNCLAQEPDYRYRKPKIDGDHLKVKLYSSASILGLPEELIV